MPVPGSTHVNPAADLVADEIMESMKKVGAQQYSTAAVDGSYTHRRAHTAGSWSGYTICMADTVRADLSSGPTEGELVI